MSVIRVNHNTNYTVMSNVHLRDMRLSLKSIGLLSKILSLPPEWDYTVEGLTAICKDGVTAVKSALKELKDCGYLIVTKRMPNETETGRIEYEYEIFEQPQGKQEAEKQEVENLPLENLPIENQRQLNTEILSKEELSKENKPDYKAEFEELWKLYPNKKGKGNAMGDYIRARKAGTTFDEVLTGIQNYSNYIRLEKIEPRFVKHGSTFFHQRSWSDEYTVNRRITTADIGQAFDFTEGL